MMGNYTSKFDLFQKLRLYSGIVLVIYALTHLLNHSLGIVNLGTMEKARLLFVAFWRTPPISWIVPAALAIHLVFVLHKLFLKATYRGLKRVEWMQIIFGLAIPILLVPHFFETRIAVDYFGINDSYSFYLNAYYPLFLIDFIVVILLVWAHGVIGLNLYLTQQQWFLKWSNIFRAFTVALPITAILGIVSAGKEVVQRQKEPQWAELLKAEANPFEYQWVEKSEQFFIFFGIGYLLFLLLFFFIRHLLLKRKEDKKDVVVKYLNGQKVAVSKGTSLLEASLQGGIPHVHACGGRGRCSTCRVNVVDGMQNISPASEEEQNLLNRTNCGKNVRLACKSVAIGHCTIFPLLSTTATISNAFNPHPERQGVDKEIAVLFSDLRGFTALTERKLPYDVVYVLNQYYQFMGQAIEANGGKVDKFIGDGIMALFGLESNLQQGCSDALETARAMTKQLALLNENLKDELATPLQIGLGIHCGPVIIGEMGYRNATSLTAIGDVVNTASRLESECKTLECEMVVSQEVANQAGFDLSRFPQHWLKIRGKKKPMLVYCVKDVAALGITA